MKAGEFVTLNRKIRQKVIVWACIQVQSQNEANEHKLLFASASVQHLNCSYCQLPITQTHANSKQNQFALDVLHTFTVILPAVIQTLNRSNILLYNLKYFLFVSLQLDHFYIILPLIETSNQICPCIVLYA